MKTLSMTHRQAAAVCMAMITAVLLFCSNTASAGCGPCAGNSTYRITVGTWPVGMGFLGTTVGVEDQTTGVRTTQTQSMLGAGSVVSQQFSTSFPSRMFDLSDITLTFCSNSQVIYQVPCDTHRDTVIHCFPVLCNGVYYCVKIQFSGAGGGACRNIRIDAQMVPPPGNCDPTFCTEN